MSLCTITYLMRVTENRDSRTECSIRSFSFVSKDPAEIISVRRDESSKRSNSDWIL